MEQDRVDQVLAYTLPLHVVIFHSDPICYSLIALDLSKLHIGRSILGIFTRYKYLLIESLNKTIIMDGFARKSI